MNILPKSIIKLIESFHKLPGIGPKTATRLAFYVLHLPQEQLDEFAKHIADVKRNTVLCSICKNVWESDPCAICSNASRDTSTICVVEQSTDVLSIEKTGTYNGVYHVLHGVIDPLNNIGPDEIYITDLLRRISDKEKPISEIIFALNPNMEGEATSMYITKQLNMQNEACKITRLAHGLPIGADIEYADEITLKRALEGRRSY
jgi:recombination protein RecR